MDDRLSDVAQHTEQVCASFGTVNARLAAGYQPLVTHAFDAASPYRDSDTVFAVRPSLVVDMAAPECRVELVLQPAGDPAAAPGPDYHPTPQTRRSKPLAARPE